MTLQAILEAEGLKSIETPEEAVAIFDQIAEALLNRATLWVAGRPHRLVEIEFYAYGPGHTDPFTHRDEMQKETACWYFHRAGKEYRGGSFKGLDISFGPGTFYGGILIRSIASLPAGGEDEVFVCGPSLCVDHLLATCGKASIKELVQELGTRSVVVEDTAHLLRLELGGERETRSMVMTPRYGLFLKKGNDESPSQDALHSRFVMREYRYLTEPRLVKKGRHFTALALALHGATVDSLRQDVGTPQKSIKAYMKSFQAGLSMLPKDFFYKKLSSNDQSALYGACAQDGTTRHGKEIAALSEE